MSNIVSGLTFPAIRGVQAGTEYYIVMCPLKRLKKIFTFDETVLSPENRAQRLLNLNRIPQITKYIHQNRNDYTFSSLTACIEGNTFFEPMHVDGHGSKIGNLHVDDDAEFYLTDGQHRSAAISRALEEDPTLGDETISVVFFVNKDLKQRQKVFRDLNLYPVKTSKSTAVLYGDSPEELLTNKVAKESSFFNGVIDFSENSISRRSAKLFKHSSLYAACVELAKNVNEKNWDAKAKQSIAFWDALASNLPLWQQAKTHQIRPQDRAHYVLFTAILLKCFAVLGRELLAEHKNWKALLKKFQEINWDRTNTAMWERRCFNNGRMAHNNTAAVLTVNVLKKHLGLALTAEQQKMENKFQEAQHGQ